MILIDLHDTDNNINALKIVIHVIPISKLLNYSSLLDAAGAIRLRISLMM